MLSAWFDPSFGEVIFVSVLSYLLLTIDHAVLYSRLSHAFDSRSGYRVLLDDSARECESH